MTQELHRTQPFYFPSHSYLDCVAAVLGVLGVLGVIVVVTGSFKNSTKHIRSIRG